MLNQEQIKAELITAQIDRHQLEKGTDIASRAMKDWGFSLSEAVEYVKTYLQRHPYNTNK